MYRWFADAEGCRGLSDGIFRIDDIFTKPDRAVPRIFFQNDSSFSRKADLDFKNAIAMVNTLYERKTDLFYETDKADFWKSRVFKKNFACLRTMQTARLFWRKFL